MNAKVLTTLLVSAISTTALAESSPVFECKFDHVTQQTKDRFVGNIRVLAKGEMFLKVAINNERANNCPLELKEIAAPVATISGSRMEFCKPRLSPDLSSKLETMIALQIERKGKMNPATAQAAVSSLEGPFLCKITRWKQKGLLKAAERAAKRIKKNTN